MILAAPLVIPFAEAVGISIATLGMAKAADMVNDYIQENPEQSMKILSTIVPGVGIGEIFMKKGKDEEVEEEVEVEDVDARDLTRAEKAKEMKRRFKEGTGDKREIGKKGYEEIILPGKEDEMLDEAEDRYDGGLEEVSKPKFDYKKFFKKRYADGGAIGIEVLFEEKKPRKDFSIGGQAIPTDRVYDPRANVEDFTKALKSVSAGTTYQQQRQAQDYARQDASRRLSEAMRSGNQSGIQSILQGIGGSTSMGGMQFNRSGNRITSIPATGPGRDKILNAMAQQMLNYTPSYQSLKPQPRDNLGLLMQDTIITDQMKSPAEMDAIRDRVLAAQKAQEQSYFMTDPVTGKKYSTEAEAIDDLGLVTYNQRFADGGRVGLFMGGSPLDGQALAIYNSMKAYGFDDQAIANALQEQGLYTPGSTPVVEEPVTNTAPNIINQGGRDGPKGDFGIFGNLLKDTAKEFNVQFYDEEYGDFIDTPVTGYKNVNTGLYQDKFGKNLQPMFSNKGQAFGISGIIAQALGLTPDTVGGYVPGSVKGKYDGVTDMFSSLKNFKIKNPFNFFKNQQATNAEIAAANLKAKQELEAKLAAEAAAAALQQQMQNTGVTGSNYNQAANIAGGGGGNTATYGGQTAREATYDGNPNTGTAQGYSQHYARGGLVTMFKEKR